MLLVVPPGIALFIGIAIIMILVWMFLPHKGLLSRWMKVRLNTKRVLLEDALKFLFDCEYKSLACNVHSIAGNLHVSSDTAARLLDRLQSMGLIEMPDDHIKLTDVGRSYALRIVRVHRIWEKYLADETGFNQLEWHGAADLKEHRMTLEVADRLAARMGNPVFDPHGDPIPSSRGEMPSPKGQPLSTLREGDIARILHIEDEPPAIYAQLVALDLYPGMIVYILNIGDGKIKFAADGEECVLTTLFASNITVEVLSEEPFSQEKYELLSSLKIGEQAEIIGISPNCRGQQRRRLMDLGIVPGTVVTAELISASGDPVAYQILGATIAIRNDQAKHIFIKRLETIHEKPA